MVFFRIKLCVQTNNRDNYLNTHYGNKYVSKK